MPESIPPGSDSDEQARRRRVGAYAKLLANYASDDAIIEAGEAAELLFVRGLAFCATSDADGFITDAQVTRYVGAGMRDAAKRAERLTQVGVWQRLDGGYLVRSWTKIHETSVEKGRRRKADRERKAKKDESQDSTAESAGNPAGIRAEGAAESLSLIQSSAVTQQRNDTTAQSDGPSGGDRPVTLRPVDATDPPRNDERCSRHPNGNPTDEPCRGCQRIEERKTARAAVAAEQAAREAERAALTCERCDGKWVVDPETKAPTKRKCDHRRAS